MTQYAAQPGPAPYRARVITPHVAGMQNVGDKKSSSGRNPQPAAFPAIPGYRFLQTIARSPKSEMHVAHSDELGHNVAVKVLRTGPLSSRPPARKSASSASATC